ncbi:hypothetical protein KS4_36960 [Poriferisphaera corsica]|uniref:Activator of Hsp90 ATPase homologue 1/2-like C-terminal domain-containing protein n=1 Tax=Poriferisphaera corsica TaxID=2528020 RepID=A0A517YZK9_9BACT|nr:SRPBCC family protein [Poriferisphaera corsica]QDU35613.1 hypothetical protein KS4_36960 [Poriferisphaera corsica]
MTTINHTHSLEIKRTFNATSQQIYQAWMDPKIRQQWFAPNHEKMTCTACKIDPKVGGQFDLTMHDDETGEDHIAVGEFIELIDNQKIVFTWSWKNKPNLAKNTHITIQLTPSDGGKKTHMTFTHVGLPDEATRDDHMKGWQGCFKSLELLLDQ